MNLGPAALALGILGTALAIFFGAGVLSSMCEQSRTWRRTLVQEAVEEMRR